MTRKNVFVIGVVAAALEMFAGEATYPFSWYAGPTVADFPAPMTLRAGENGFSYDGFAAADGSDLRVKDAEGNLRALPDIFRDLAVKMNARPTADKLALAKDIFDVRASGAGLALAANAEQLDAFLAKLRDVTGAASDTATAMDAGLGGSLRILKSAVEAVQLALGRTCSRLERKL